MPRFYKLRVPGDTVTDFSPNRSLDYKLSTSGYATFTNAVTDVSNSELIFLGSKADLRRLDAIDSNLSKLFVMLRSQDPNDTDSFYNSGVAFRARGLNVARTLSTIGPDVTSSTTVNFDGTANVAIPVTLSTTGVVAGTYNKVSVDAKGRVLQGLALTSADIEAALGYTPLPSGGGSSASFADALTNPRNFSISGGDAAAGITSSFDGTQNVALSLTLSNTGVSAGTYNQVEVDAKGRVVSASVQPYLTSEADTLATVTARGASTGSAITLSNATQSTSTATGALVVTGGVGMGGNLWVGGTANIGGTFTANTSVLGPTTLSSATITNNASVGGNLTITGNLTVTGTTTTTSSNSITLTDALLYLSSNATTAADTRDRGIAFNYGTGSAVNTGFFGWDQSTNRFVFIPQASIVSDVVTGTVGTIEASLFGNATTATTLQTSRNFSISGGDATTGTTISFNGSGNVSLPLTLTNTGVVVGTYAKVSVDAKGRVLAGFALSSTDVTTALGYTPISNAGGTFTGDVSITGNLSVSGTVSAADPTAEGHLVTRRFLESRSYKTSVRVATTTTLNLSSPGASIDGVTMTSGDRVLVKDQGTPAQNGVYIWNGSASTMTRATDFDLWTDVIGATVVVEQGTANSDSFWLCTADRGGTIGTTAIAFRRVAPQVFQISGGDAAAGTVINFDGTSTVVLPLTLTNTGVVAGTYNTVVVNAQGRVTSALNTPSSDTLQNVTTRGNTTTTTISINNSTDSTGTSSGALVVQGGVGIGGSVFVGGRLVTAASSTVSSGLTLPHGSAPTSPNNGDIWTTTTAIQARMNGTTRTVAFTDSNITGSAASLTTTRNFSISGGDAVAGTTVGFNGTGDVAMPLTLANTGVAAGTYNQVVVDAKGRVTAAAVVGYQTGNQSITLTGDASGTGTTTIPVTLAETGVVAGTYLKVSVDAKGRVLAGLPLLASDVSGALGYTPVSAGGGTFTGNVSITGNLTVTGTASAADPTADTNLTTRQWVEARSAKTSARVATTGNINISSPGTTIDGVTMTTGDRVLVRAQTTTSQNGIYVWNGGASAMTRATDADTWLDLVGASVAVQQGTSNGDTIWLCTSDTGGTLGSTAVSWQLVNNPLLASIGGVTGAADRLIYLTGATTATITTLTSYARTLLDDNDAATARTTLGLGTSDAVSFGSLSTSGSMAPGGTLTLAAGTTTMAALRFTSGAQLTAPVAGSVEWNGSNLFITQTTGPTRRQLAFITDNVATASALQTARAINTGGGDAATGTTVNFDGTGAITIPVTLSNTGVSAGTYNTVVVDAKGRVTAASNSALTAESDTLQTVTTRGATTNVATVTFSASTSSSTTSTGAVVVTGGVGIGGALNVGGNVTVGGNLVVNGTTYTVNSSTVTYDDPVLTLGGDTAPVADDNTDRGIEFRWHNGSTAQLGFFGFRDSNSRFVFIPSATNTAGVYSGTIGTIEANLVGAVTGNASTATALQTARNIVVSGNDAAAGTAVSFDGTGNVSLPLTLSNTGVVAGTYNQVVVDAKGRVTSAAVVGYLTGNQTITLTGDASGSGTTSIPVTLASTGVGAGTYTRVTVDTKGRVTSASNIQLLMSDVVVVTNAGTTTYSFTRSAAGLTLNPNFITVYVNRTLVRPSEYSVSGNNVTFSLPLSVDDELEVVTLG